MASVFDLGPLQEFSIIFSWLLFFILIYGFLEVANLFKNKAIHGVTAFAIATIAIFNPTASDIITGMIPWFVILGFFFFIIFAITRFMGFETGTIQDALGGGAAVWWVLGIGLVIFSLTVVSQFGDNIRDAQDADEPTQRQEVINTLTDSRVMGIILIFLVGLFTVTFLARGPGGAL